MAFDAHKNLAVALVTAAPSPPTSGTVLAVTTGQGARFPAVPFNATVWPAAALPDPTTAEVVRVTAIAGDSLTIVRAQEGTSARGIAVGDLIAQTITAKTLTDLETQTALLAAPNVFTSGRQSLQMAAPILVWYDTSVPVDARVFRIMNGGQGLYFQALNDAQSLVTGTPAVFARSGDVTVGRDVYEKGRLTPIGHWITPPFLAGNFAAASGTWTVTAGQAMTNRYTLIGKTLIWQLNIDNSTHSAATSSLLAVIPGGFAAATAADGICKVYDGATHQLGEVTWGLGSTAVSVVKVDFANWPAGVFYLRFSITMEVQ